MGESTEYDCILDVENNTCVNNEYYGPKNVYSITIEEWDDVVYAEEVLTSRNLDKGLGIFFMKDFGISNYKVKEANVGDQAIELKIGEKLLFNNSYLEKGKRVFSMELKHIMYSYEGTGHPTCYRLTKVSSSLISPIIIISGSCLNILLKVLANVKPISDIT